MVGWNIEIMFMFSVVGIIFYNTLPQSPKEKILGVQAQWFFAVGYAAFCVFIEILLNLGGHLVWKYAAWNRSIEGVWLIFLFGYFHFYVAAIAVINLEKKKQKTLFVVVIYSIAIAMNVFGMGIMGWVY